MNTPDGVERVRELYGNRVVILPYVKPGCKLARLCAETFPNEASAQTVGIVLMQHGLFTFGESAQSAYERMIELVTLAEDYLDRHGAWNISHSSAPAAPDQSEEIARLRRDLSSIAGKPMILMTHA